MGSLAPRRPAWGRTRAGPLRDALLVAAPILVVVIGPWRLELRPDADRWQGVDAPTDAMSLRGWRAALGWLHLSVRIETFAVMVHAMGGAGGRRNARGSSSHARVAGKLCGPLWRRPHTVVSVRPIRCRPKPVELIALPPLEGGQNNNPTLPSASGSGDCTSSSSKRTVASAPSEPFLPRLRYGRRAVSSGPFRAPRWAPPEDGYGGKR